jgi:hypothetical protein
MKKIKADYFYSAWPHGASGDQWALDILTGQISSPFSEGKHVCDIPPCEYPCGKND